MGPTITFTYEEVARAASKDPKQRQEQFSQSIDVDDMANDAAIYREAAAAAGSAAQLAQKADTLSAGSGALDGRDIANAQGRYETTRLGLQDNGSSMYDAADILIRSMNWAIEEEEKVRSHIEGPDGIEAEIGRQNGESMAEWGRWYDSLAAEVNRVRAQKPPPRLPPALTISAATSQGAKSWPVPPPPLGGNYELPDDLAQDVRGRHLEIAAQAARTKDAEIAEEINQYRHTLAGYGRELTELGYDLSQGPLGLWTSPEAGAIDARMLSEELAKEQPNQNLVNVYTERLEQIAAAVQGGDPHQPGRPLDRESSGEEANELEYLRSFFGQLDPNAYAAIGGVEGDPRTAVANGLNMLTSDDPAIGGDPAAVPEGIKEYIYNYSNSDLPQEQFNQFGQLMGSATIAPGDEMARRMTQAAIDVQQLNAARVLAPLTAVVPNTFSSDLLQNVSLNEAASAGILNDQALREDLLNTTWERSEGVASVVTSGTTIPEHLRGTEGSAPYVNAGYNVLQYAAHNQDDILGPPAGWNDYLGVPDDFVNHGALQSAVGDTAVRYMDLISMNNREISVSPENFPGGAYPSQEYQPGFNLSQQERRDLFHLMASAEEGASRNFYESVGAWKQDTLTAAFAPTTPNIERGAYFGAVGSIAGTEAYMNVIPAEHTARIEAWQIAGAKAALGFAGPVGGAIGEAGSTLYNPNDALDDAKRDAGLHESFDERIMMADGARAAGYPVPREPIRESLDPLNPHNVGALSRYLAAMEPQYHGYIDSFDREYNQAVEGGGPKIGADR